MRTTTLTLDTATEDLQDGRSSERLKSYALGVLIAAIMTVVGWCTIILAWAMSA